MTATLYLAPNLDSALAHAAAAAAESQRLQPFAPVHLLLPDRQAVQAARKRLGDRMGVRFYQFYGLGQQVLDRAALPVQRISDTALHRLVRQVLRQLAEAGRLSTFLPVWETPGFSQVLVEWLHEMKSQGIPPEQVRAQAAAGGQARDRQLAEFYQAYQDFLIQNQSSDADGLLWLAAETLEARPDLPIGQPLWMALGFDQFNPLQLRMLRSIAPRCPDFRIYLAWDAARPDGSLALTQPALTRQALEQALPLRVETLADASTRPALLTQIQHGLFEAAPATPAAPLANSGVLQLVAAPGREAEVRWALKAIKRRLLAGATPDEVALLAPNPAAYQRMVEVAAEEYGLPVQLERRLVDAPLAAALLNLLELAPEFPWRGTLDALRSPYFAQAWLSQPQIDQLERLSRERPVLQGRDQWREALQPLERASQADEVDDEDLGPERLARQLSREELGAIESGLMAFFDLLTPPERASCRGYALWLQETVLGLFPEVEEEGEAPAPPPSLGLARACQAPAAFARRDRQALQLVARALAGLVQAAELVSPGDELLAWPDFRDELQRALAGIRFGSDPLGPGVRFASLEAGRALAVDYLFVLGLAEGEFPRLPAPDVLYAPRERETSPLPLVRRPAGDQASLWWQVLNNCRTALTLLRPRLDEKGAPWLASSFWEAVVSAARGAGDLAEQQLPVVAQPGRTDAASPAELLMALALDGARTVPAQLQPAWQASQAALALMARRQSWRPLAAFEGVLQEPGILAELGQRFGPQHNWSASRLMSYGSCAYAFFAQAVLDLQASADPAAGFDVLQRGTLLHAILEDLYRQMSAEGLLPSSENVDLLAERLANCCDRAFRGAPRRYGFRADELWTYQQAELRRLLEALLRWECSQNGAVPTFRPYQQELRFGIQADGLPPLTVSTADGFAFRLHGVIDRLDRDEGGRLRLVDYKSGSTKYSKPDITKGLALQAPLYALAAEQLQRAQVAESGYLHIALREPSGKLTFQGSVQADEFVQKAVEMAAKFVQSARGGRYPAWPAKPSQCARCDFSALCRADRHAFAKAKQEAAQ